MPSDRDRNEAGQYADGIDPETVLDVFDAREDRARPVTASDVVDALGIARRTAHNKLNALVERGVLETRKVGARGRVFWVPLRDESDATREPRDAAGQSSYGPDDADEPPRDDADGHAADQLDGALVGWEPETQVDAKTARAQTRRTAEYLREHAPERFTKSELQTALAGESTLGERSWWERAVRPGLQRLADTGLVEYRAGNHDYRWKGA